jgi:acetyl-CoA synthetase
MRRATSRNHAAIIWEGEPGDRRTLTYWDLYRQVSAFANVLKKLGVKKGDRVALYLPLIPELAIAMLACARIGAVHSVVFGGFSSESLSDRINDSQCVLLVTADGGYRRGNIVPLKQMADEALRDTPSIKHVVVVQRQAGAPIPVHIQEGRDHWYPPPDAGRRLCTASPRRWTPRTCSTSSTRPAPPGSRRASSTRPAAISPAPTRRPSGSSI